MALVTKQEASTLIAMLSSPVFSPVELYALSLPWHSQLLHISFPAPLLVLHLHPPTYNCQLLLGIHNLQVSIPPLINLSIPQLINLSIPQLINLSIPQLINLSIPQLNRSTRCNPAKVGPSTHHQVLITVLLHSPLLKLKSSAHPTFHQQDSTYIYFWIFHMHEWYWANVVCGLLLY
jgi:hypothetical protein